MIRSPKTTRSSAHFMCSHWTHVVAQGFGSGLSPIMPGTIGTLFGWCSFSMLSLRWPQIFTPQVWAWIIGVGFVAGVAICDKTGRDLGVSDHGSIVWDEIIAIWLVLLFLMPCSWSTQLAAFLVFRLFDMVKPQPIRYFDFYVKGGLGVMWDDIVAAFFTLLVFAIWLR